MEITQRLADVRKEAEANGAEIEKNRKKHDALKLEVIEYVSSRSI